MSISVAIVTARKNEHTSLDRWKEYGRRFLLGEWSDPAMTGEWGALVGALRSFADFPNQGHIEYQMRALTLQTRPPDQVLVVFRNDQAGWGGFSTLPMSTMGIKWFPAAHPGPMPVGCADKNQAIAACETDHLIMLDDCCIPGFGFVEIAERVCKEGNILLPEHHKIHLPVDGKPCAVSKANVTGSDTGRRVFGIWAMPISIARDTGGYDESLDGKHGLWDEEYISRMDLYAKDHGIEYVRHPRARVYEIEHTRPWEAAGGHPSNLLEQRRSAEESPDQEA